MQIVQSESLNVFGVPICHCGSQWLGYCTLNAENPCLNPVLLVESWASLFSQHCLSSLSCMNEYQAIDCGGYLCMSSLCTLIAAWLDASKRSRGV